LHEAKQQSPSNEASHVLMNFSGQNTATLAARHYLTQNVELLLKDDYILSQDENDPDGPLVPRRVKEVYIRKVPAIQMLTLRSSCGQLHVIYTTREHPFYLDVQGFLRCVMLRVGDQVRELSGGVSTVVESRFESRPEGILVYNVEVEDYHTYFVRAEGSTAEPVWVHNYNPRLDGEILGQMKYDALEYEDGPVASSRNLRDEQVDPMAPRPRPTDRPIGDSPSQNAAAQAEVARMIREGYKDIRVNQEQVNAEGERVGINRPDVQGTSPEGIREYHEFDTDRSYRGPEHEARLSANDPNGRVILHTVN
jgi:hypothetical protein